MSRIVERISRIIENKGISNRAFEMSIGASNGMIGRAIAKGTDITAEWLSKIIDNYPDVNADWLLTGKGEIFQTKSTEFPVKENDRNVDRNFDRKRKVQISRSNAEPEYRMVNDVKTDDISDKTEIKSYPKDDQTRVAMALQSDEGIPLIPLDAVAGFCNGDYTQVMEYECEKYVIPSFRGADFMISVRGDSMEPKYLSGDVVACKSLPMDTFFQWNKVYVVGSDQGVLIKRVRQGPDDEHILLVSENEEYKPFPLRLEEVHSLALVIGVIRFE